MAGYQALSKEDTQQSNTTGSDDQAPHAASSPAEELAASIFQFVQIAASLGSTLSTISAEHEAEDVLRLVLLRFLLLLRHDPSSLLVR